MLMQGTKAFIFKERRLANTFWLWGVLYPFLLLSIISLIYVIYPFLSHWLQFIVISSFQVLLLIEVFFSLFLTYRVFDSNINEKCDCFCRFFFSQRSSHDDQNRAESCSGTLCPANGPTSVFYFTYNL